MSRRSTPSSKSTRGEKPSQTQRLQRLLASAGFGSRRLCEELIEAGRVEVDGEVVTKLGTTVDPEAQKVRVDGVLLKKQKLVYFAVNKPVGVVTTNSDPQGRPRVVDLVPKSERVFAVGRLDRSSEGLILLTNDGDLAQKLTHPKFGVRKIYRVMVAGRVDGETMKRMRQGIFIAEGRVSVEGAKIIKARGKATEMEISLREGKNREIRRILARLGHKVLQLRRIAVGSLRLGDMPPGAYRIVSREEVRKLQKATEPSPETDSPKRRSKRGGPQRATGLASGSKDEFTQGRRAGSSDARQAGASRSKESKGSDRYRTQHRIIGGRGRDWCRPVPIQRQAATKEVGKAKVDLSTIVRRQTGDPTWDQKKTVCGRQSGRFQRRSPDKQHQHRDTRQAVIKETTGEET